MAAAAVGRLPALSSVSSSRKWAACTLPPRGRAVACRAHADQSSSAVLEKQGVPLVHQKRPPIYKVLLHNDDYNKREYVVKVLMRVLADMTVDDAVQVMQEAHETGVALARACPQNEAEAACEALRLNGLCSTIEPGC